ncbi:MAG: glycosyltransferase family 1 protein [Gammaproteobacteria bacterium]|nr:glycosyltransferase family 1 protein [Gammaproteobacteria bacterium]MBU1624823.1 glycosyltransferase family 1 protein [Gammaproteobacteria bacterium]MBU1982667.1 glycosyltransferase family 1 protein [Gammaproteobacteria bacterium]
MRAMNTPNETLQVAPALSIALVTETYVPEVNGVAITIGRMVHGLLKRGHRIHMIRPRQGKQDAPAAEGNYAETLVSGMPIPGYPELKSGLPAKNLLLKLWRKQQPDVVHIATEGPLGWSALSAARKLGIPVCTDFHTNFHNYTQHYGIGLLKKPIAAYLRHFHNKAACTLVPTASLQQQLEHEGYQNVLVVSRGVDTELFHPAKRDAELRASWNASDDTPVVMLVSRIAPEKNLHVVIQAFEQMRKINPLLRLVMVGDGPARAELQKQHPQVIFAGMQTGEALARHYASGDIFLYPSLTETYGNVTVEAMASGLATLAYNYAAAQQHIKHDVNGLLATFADSDAFIAEARTLANDLPRVRRLGLTARDTVESLTWEHIMGQMEAVLLDTVRSQGVKNGQPELSAATD